MQCIRSTQSKMQCIGEKQDGCLNPGAASAGVPLAILVEKFGWNAFFTSLGASCILVVLLILPCINLKSYNQKIQEANAKAA